MFKDELQKIIKDLNKHKHNYDDLLPLFVEERLNKSLVVYYKNLIETSNSIKYRTDSANVMKKLLKDD